MRDRLIEFFKEYGIGILKTLIFIFVYVLAALICAEADYIDEWIRAGF